MPTPAATTPATHAQYRPRLSSVFGAAFVGCTLIAVMAPAHADPIASAEISFERPADSTELGDGPLSNTLTVLNTGGLAICLLDLQTNASEFPAGAPQASLLASQASTASTVSGSPVQETTVVAATLKYAAAPEDGVCADIDPDTVQVAVSGTWTVTATEPEPSPSPTPTEEPTEEPTKEPSPSPTRTPSPTPTNSPSPSESNSSSPSPSATATEGNRSGSGNNNRSPSSTPDRTPPRSSVSSVPTSGADIPTLPRNEADLPDLSPGAAEDLAELPLVTPTSDEDTETEIAADHSDMGTSIAPAVLLAAFLLALLLATPLAPTRRVRLGNGYQGKRRKG